MPDRLIKEALEIKDLILKNFDGYETIYLDGVSCGAKFFATALVILHRNNVCLSEKIVFNCINGVIAPEDIKSKDFDLAKTLPYWLGFIMTPVLRLVHSHGWRREAHYYDMLDNRTVQVLNADANRSISWRMLKDQVEAMNYPKFDDGPIILKSLRAALSEEDDFIDNESALESLTDLFYSKDFTVFDIPTGHSTLTYEPNVWKKRFFIPSQKEKDE
jgi:hypothetical protein